MVARNQGKLISKTLDKEVKKFHSQKLSDEYQYLILDGVRLTIRGVRLRRKSNLSGLWDNGDGAT